MTFADAAGAALALLSFAAYGAMIFAGRSWRHPRLAAAAIAVGLAGLAVAAALLLGPSSEGLRRAGAMACCLWAFEAGVVYEISRGAFRRVGGRSRKPERALPRNASR